ncbi:MAG: tetratricopeptide repeat protein [Proteobacteria bacterium]|nr:MAG: tetratricopeptide repeat protein [Pseudomonadota bacterium]
MLMFKALHARYGARCFLLPLLICATVLLDAHSIGQEFIWDDQFFIAENQFLRSVASLPKLFITSITEGAGGQPTNFYRPLQAVSHLLDVQLFGLNPVWHHATNIALHALMGALFFLLLCRLLKEKENKWIPYAAFGAVALWMLHPLQNFAAGYLSGRGDTLVGIFTAAAALTWPKRRWLAGVYCALAVLSKESGILAPLFVVLVDFAERRLPLKSIMSPWKYLPIAVPAAFYVALRLTALNFSNTLNFYNQANVLTENYSFRVFTFLTVFAKGLALIFWPVDLHHERSWFVYGSFDSPLVITGAALLLGLVGIAIYAWPRARLLSVGIIWFLLAQAPTSNLIALINALIYDHWFLLPSLGFMLAAGWLLNRALQRFAFSAVLGAWALCLLPLVVLSWGQLGAWQTARAQYEHILSYEPRSSKIMNNLGMIYAQEGEPERAQEIYRRSLELSETPEGRNNLGNLYLIAGKFQEAERELTRALELAPSLYQASTNLGRLKLRQNNCGEAEAHFRAALRRFPDPAAAQGLELTRECFAAIRK